MVNQLTIVFMAISSFIAVLFPVVLLTYFRKKYKISWRAIGIGALGFIVFSQVLEKILHVVVLGNNLITNPVVVGLYGALAAGVFEETGRFIFIKLLLKENREWKDGIAYGIGHGGIEAILIGVITGIQYIAYAVLINTGMYDKVLASQVSGNEAALKSVAALKDTLINGAPSLFLMGGFERIMAVIIHIAFTMIVLCGIRNRKNIYLLYAILVHTLFDLFPAFYQAKLIGLMETELLLLVFTIGAVVFLFKFKGIFKKDDSMY